MRKRLIPRLLKLTVFGLAAIIIVAASLSMLARKHYAPGLKIRSAWLFYVGGDGGWRIAVEDAVAEADSAEELVDALGEPVQSFKEGNKTTLLYSFGHTKRGERTIWFERPNGT